MKIQDALDLHLKEEASRIIGEGSDPTELPEKTVFHNYRKKRYCLKDKAARRAIAFVKT